MIKNIHILLLFLSFVQFSFSQEIEFGKVSREELLEKVYSKDSSANAAILYRNQKTYYTSNASGLSLITVIHERIKIYNKEGFDKATVSVKLFKTPGSRENIGKLKAYTYNLEDGKIKKSELEKKQVFKSEYSYNYNEVKFTMPDVKEGSVLDITYKITSPFYFSIDEFRFQFDVPVKKLYAQLRTPKVVNFKESPKGYITIMPKRSTKRDVGMNMTANILEYDLADIPALKEESFVNNINNYRSGVIFELTSIVVPGERPQYYSTTWGDVAKTIGNSDDYRNELDRTNSFDDSLDEIIAGKTDGMEKMESVLKHVKESIKWNGIDGKYFQNGIKKTLKEKKGNAADVNLTLVAMLRYAGLDANPLVLSTRDNLVPFFPTIDKLNHVIAYVELNEKRYFLDATEEFSDINMLPLKDYNWQGILVNNNKMVWKKVSIKSPDTGISQYIIDAKIDEEGTLEGGLKARYTNHTAYQFRNKYKDKQDLDTYLIAKEKSLEDIEISEYEAENAETYEGNVTESFKFFKEASVDMIDDKMYVVPSLFLKISENPFKLEERQFPIDFGYPKKERYMVNIEVPSGLYSFISS